jgi:hypothetical protein
MEMAAADRVNAIPTRFDQIAKYVRLGASIWLLAFYLIPNTVWSERSPLSILPLFYRGAFESRYVAGCTIGSLVICYGLYRVLKPTAKRMQLLLLITAYLSSYCITALLTGRDVIEVSNCVVFLCSIGIGLLATIICARPNVIATAFTVLAATQAVYAINSAHMGHNLLRSGLVDRLSGTFNFPISLNFLMLVCLPIAIVQTVQTRKTVPFVFRCVCCSVILAALVLTWFRGGMVAAFISLGWLGYRLIGRKAASAVVVLALGLCVILTLHVRTAGETNYASSPGSTIGRYVVWQRGIRIAERHWTSGVGLGALTIPIKDIGKEPDSVAPTLLLEPENLFLFWCDELGIAGSLMFILFVIAIMRCLHGAESPMAFGVAASWIAVFVIGLVSTPFGTPDRVCGNVLIGYLLGLTLLVAESNSATDVEAEEIPRNVRRQSVEVD